MKKNLVYYSIGVKDEYVEMLKLSLMSIDNSNPSYQDVLIITDKEYYDNNFINFDRPNTSFFLLPKVENSDQACFNKLKIFQFSNVYDYEKILYLDTDTIVNVNLDIIFDRLDDDGKLCAPVEDYWIDNHRRIQFSLGTYQDEDIVFFEKNKIYTFNAGTFMFKSSLLMKKHFSNVLNIIKNHEGDYFMDQSFVNYYFNTYKLSDTTKIVKDIDYLYIVESNFYDNIDYTNKIMHVISEQFTTVSKLDKMKELSNRIYGLWS